MEQNAREMLERAKQLLRAAILFDSLKPARLALEALEEINQSPTAPSAFEALKGGCEFCPADGGGCGVCGTWN